MGIRDIQESGLTLQQENVALKLAAGYRVKETAKEFGISANTVHRWLTEPIFSEMVMRVGQDAVRAGVSWAATRYQTYLDTCEEIALDETKGTRDRLHALDILLKRAERASEDAVQQQLNTLKQAVFGEDAIDVIAHDLQEVNPGKLSFTDQQNLKAALEESADFESEEFPEIDT